MALIVFVSWGMLNPSQWLLKSPQKKRAMICIQSPRHCCWFMKKYSLNQPINCWLHPPSAWWFVSQVIPSIWDGHWAKTGKQLHDYWEPNLWQELLVARKGCGIYMHLWSSLDDLLSFCMIQNDSSILNNFDQFWSFMIMIFLFTVCSRNTSLNMSRKVFGMGIIFVSVWRCVSEDLKLDSANVSLVLYPLTPIPSGSIQDGNGKPAALDHFATGIYIYMIIIIISKWIIFESKTRLLSAFPWKTHGSTCPRSAPRLCGPRGYGSSSRTRRTRSSHHHWYPPPLNWPNANDENQWLTNSPVVTHQLERKQPWLKLENNRPKRLAEFGRSSEHPFSYEIAPRLCWDRLTSLWSGQFGGLKEAIDNIR